jgi:hypothetical protein
VQGLFEALFLCSAPARAEVRGSVIVERVQPDMHRAASHDMDECRVAQRPLLHRWVDGLFRRTVEGARSAKPECSS